MRKVALACLCLALTSSPAEAAPHRSLFARPARPGRPPTMPRVLPLDRSVCGDEAVGCYNAEENVMWGSQRGFAYEHELGHAVAFQTLSDAEISSWMNSIAPIAASIEPDAGWMGYDDGGAYIFGGVEVFADAYASCRLGLLPVKKVLADGSLIERWDSGYGYDPGSNSRQRRICARIARWVRSPR